MFELFYIKHLFKTSIKRKHKEIVNTKSIITMEGFRGHTDFQLKNSVENLLSTKKTLLKKAYADNFLNFLKTFFERKHF